MSGRIEGSGGSTDDIFALSVSAEPEFIIDLPPLRIAPENASWSDFWSSSNFDVFTDEIEKSTMKRQNRSVIMSAKDTSQRSSFSCSSSWCPPFLWRL